MIAVFNDKFLGTQVAMRGGTLLHKVYLAPIWNHCSARG